MRILLLSHLFAHNTANTYRYWALCKYLSDKGYTVDIVGFKNVPPQKKLPDNVAYFSFFSVIRLKTIFPLIWSTFLEFSKIFFKRKSYIKLRSGLLNGGIKILLKHLLRAYHYDLIIVSVVPWTYYAFLPFLKQYTAIVLDVSDPLYKNAVLDSKQKGFQACKILEKKAFDCADRIILMSEPLVIMYEQELEIDSRKMKFISPSISLDKKYSYQKKRYQFSQVEPLKFLYAGAIYPGYRDVNEFVKAFRLLPRGQVEIISNLKGEDSSQVKYSSWLSKEKLYEKYQACDILIFIDNFFGYQVPSKIFELIALNKPILFIYDERNTYFYNLLKGQKGIFFVRNISGEIEQKILEIMGLAQICVEYDYDLEPYSDRMMCQHYENCMLDALHKTNPPTNSKLQKA